MIHFHYYTVLCNILMEYSDQISQLFHEDQTFQGASQC